MELRHFNTIEAFCSHEINTVPFHTPTPQL